IFVHGLGGDAIESWGFKNQESWKTWIPNKRPDVKIWSLSYEIEPWAWTGASMPLFDRAINVLALLRIHEIVSEPIVFVCHSMGGLLVKEILRNAKTTASNEYEDTVKNVKAIGFIATPHSGSELADIAGYLRVILRLTVSVSELRSSGAQL